MKKSYLLSSLTLSLLLCATPVLAGNNSIGPSATKLYKNSDFEILKKYNILLTSYENGISTYSGVEKGLRINFTVSNEQVDKIVFMFDNDISASERQSVVNELIDITDQLLPKKIKSVTKAANDLQSKIKSLKGDRDADVFTLNRLRVELNLANHILNIRITP